MEYGSMPVHDWTRVDATIFHDFRHSWMSEISRSLNRGLLSDDFYALVEQPQIVRNQSPVGVHRSKDDQLEALVEVISPDNKAGREALQSFVSTSVELLQRHIHLLIVDLHPPGVRDPHGSLIEIWNAIARKKWGTPPDKPVNLAAYEADVTVRAYVDHVKVGGVLPEMPLFLEPQQAVNIPLETSYQQAFAAVPRRWRSVLEAPCI